MDNDFEIVGMEICDMKNTYYLKPTGRYEINKQTKNLLKKSIYFVGTYSQCNYLFQK